MKKATLALLFVTLFILLRYAGRLAAQPNPSPLLEPAGPTGVENAPAHFWLSERITSPMQLTAMSDRSLALDAAGRPHLVYGVHSVYYAWHDGASWQRDIVDDLYHDSGRYASIALDSEGVPHIAYVQELGPAQWALRYATRQGDDWRHLSFDSAIGLAFAAIAVDTAGQPHLAYFAGYGRGLHYVHQVGQQWFNVTVDTEDPRFALSLALDPAGRPHFAYVTNTNKLKYATWLDDHWHVEAITSLNNPQFNQLATSIAVDSQGQPAILYQSNQGIRLATPASAGWNLEVVNNDTGASWLSLALDGNDVPHISYYGSAQDSQMYATRPADTWIVTPVDATPHAGLFNAIALDAQGQPHISYARYRDEGVDLQAGEMRYARLEGGNWAVETADTGGYDYHSALAIDSQDRLHLLYQDWVDNGWHYAYQTENGWATEATTLPPPWYYYPGISLLTDAQDNPRLIYFDNQDALRYGYRQDGVWSSQVITTATGSAYSWLDSALALDSNQTPHVAFHRYQENELYYAYLANDVWLVETVEKGIVSDSSIVLAFDSLDQPHLFYYNTAYQLRYARRLAGQWHIETIGTGFPYLALALDSQDQPHLITWASEGWQYSYWTGTDWVNQIIEPVTGGSGRFEPAFALDPNGRPHVAYQGYTNYHYYLRYAHYDGSVWRFHQADSGWDVGIYASLVVNSQGLPFILHSDTLNGHIKLSRLATSVTFAPLILTP